MSSPELSPEETVLLDGMRARLRQEIELAGGLLPFDRYMETALYAPGLGYYVNGRRKFGEAGDFITAPEVSPLFSRCLARQVATCLQTLGGGDLLEFGAGSGRMAADMLAELEALDRLPDRYLILDLSPSLKALQAETLRATVPQLFDRVEWIDALPAAGFKGVVVGNELLDAMPVHRFRIASSGWEELFVGLDESGFAGQWRELRSVGLEPALSAIWPDPADRVVGYDSEVNLRLTPWLQALSGRLQQAYLVLIDYGYTAREYYHPERNQGTLICHFRHRAHADPFLLPGLQDMTANVDFSALAGAAVEAGFDLAGFTTQAHFLIDNGLDELMMASDPAMLQSHMQLAMGVKKLTLPSEMGERFKVMTLAYDAPVEPAGFVSRDLRGRL